MVLNKLLVAYAENIHDDLGLSLALRMLINDPNRQLEILQFLPTAAGEIDSSYEFRRMFELLPSEVKTRLHITNLESAEPMQVVIEASQNVDLTIAGTSRTWGIERQTLGLYTDRLAQECQSSLLITRRYSPVNNHLQSLFTYGKDTIRS